VNCNSGPHPLRILNEDIVACERCPRLVRYRREVAATKRRAYIDWDYWGKPVPSFGDPAARLLVLGLAPAAHGGNRTGRMFTGDRSGDFLYRALYRAGFASQPESRAAGDGLELQDAWISAAAHCAPPDNKPSTDELRTCGRFLDRELKALDRLKLVVVLGRIAMDAYRAARGITGIRFGHNLLHETLDPPLLCSYHPSQQNTSTGRLTEAMLDDVFGRARKIIES
jgi:uracil-DNA glycosylase family 4